MLKSSFDGIIYLHHCSLVKPLNRSIIVSALRKIVQPQYSLHKVLFFVFLSKPIHFVPLSLWPKLSIDFMVADIEHHVTNIDKTIEQFSHHIKARPCLRLMWKESCMCFLSPVQSHTNYFSKIVVFVCVCVYVRSC